MVNTMEKDSMQKMEIMANPTPIAPDLANAARKIGSEQNVIRSSDGVLQTRQAGE